ncbi:hypothetical protein N7509_008968 [Penicillium cosmopolitanum]|uniref:Uncharacterized protein n=1 Tax=Penicillium cosmopolitanum TaxID=1131564 RepID=A0A9W9VNM2_9EURO|nr:uncharacterized protein N7509_008968 [Penicillium cosmopolitanum]KAJ5386427.1 hypothetical protein N7509_008968 [Penicillium cosmopolitanum]
MLDDSGADQMSILYGDLVLLQNMEAAATGAAPSKLPVCVGVFESLLGDGSSAIEYARMIQAAIFADNNGGVMTNLGQEWDLILCFARDGYQPDPEDGRIAGLWSRFKLYTGLLQTPAVVCISRISRRG